MSSHFLGGVPGQLRQRLPPYSEEVIKGEFPRRTLSLVLDWAKLHQDELLENWGHYQTHQQPVEIPFT